MRQFSFPFSRGQFVAVSVCCAWILFHLTGCTNTLNRAIYREHPELVQKFLAEGADVNQTNDDGGTPLIYAAQYGDLALIKTLVERGANVNWTDKTGNSALCYLAAGKSDKNNAVSFLLVHGAEVNKANDDGFTALHFAAAHPCEAADAPRQQQLIALLLNAGSDPDLYTKRGDLALHLAAAANQSDAFMERLLSATKTPQRLNHAGHNALSSAAKGGAHGAAVFLIAHAFSPQELVPAPPRIEGSIAMIDVFHEINARAHEAVGDYAASLGDKTKAVSSYRTSAKFYHDAVTDCQTVVNLYDSSLKAAKSGRKSRLIGTIAANVVGGGLAAVTGVGFVAIPKRGENNHIDEYVEALEKNQAELSVLTRDQSNLAAKLSFLEATLKTEPVPSPAVVPAAVAVAPAAP